MIEKISSLCDAHKISIAQLERECGIGNGTIARWKTSKPNLRTLEKVSNYFHLSVQYFLE